MNKDQEYRHTIDSDPTVKRIPNTIVLPDGTRKEPMGSGYITGLLGVGGMANVYEIWNPQLEISRAVKLLHPNYTEESKQRFETEIKITAKLHHPNIIEIHAVGHWNGLPFIEMERIDGLTLDTLINERGALPTEVCTSIGIMMGRSLRFAHNQEYVIYGQTYYGVIHRDLKPSNIMINYKGILKLMDFGIARPTDASIHTTDGSILGTMQYLSPEQLEGNVADIRTDIYSIGAILYEMLTGVKAFPEQNVSKLMMSKVKNDFRSLEEFDVKIPVKLKRLVHRCLAHNPERRISDTTTLLEELGRIHKAINSQSPEQVLRRFIGESTGKRMIPSVRKRIPVKTLTMTSFLIFFLVFLIKYGAPVYSSLQNQFFIKTQQPALVSSTDTQIFRELDTINALQKQIESSLQKNASPKSVSRKEKQSVSPELTLDNSAVATLDAKHEDQTFVGKLKAKYGTDDLKLILENEAQARNYSIVIQLFDSIPANDRDKKVVIYTMRAFRSLNDLDGLRKIISNKTVDDAEFYLEAAKLRLFDGQSSECLTFLALCEKTPGAYSDSKNIRIERLYLTAKCKSKIFDLTPSVEAKNGALDGWFEIKAELQTSQDHRYFKEADLEMQRITTKMN